MSWSRAEAPRLPTADPSRLRQAGAAWLAFAKAVDELADEGSAVVQGLSTTNHGDTFDSALPDFWRRYVGPTSGREPAPALSTIADGARELAAYCEGYASATEWVRRGVAALNAAQAIMIGIGVVTVIVTVGTSAAAAAAAAVSAQAVIHSLMAAFRQLLAGMVVKLASAAALRAALSGALAGGGLGGAFGGTRGWLFANLDVSLDPQRSTVQPGEVLAPAGRDALIGGIAGGLAGWLAGAARAGSAASTADDLAQATDDIDNLNVVFAQVADDADDLARAVPSELRAATDPDLIDLDLLSPKPVWRTDSQPLYRSDSRHPVDGGIWDEGLRPLATRPWVKQYLDPDALPELHDFGNHYGRSSSLFVSTSRARGILNATRSPDPGEEMFVYQIQAPGGVDLPMTAARAGKFSADVSAAGNAIARQIGAIDEVTFPGGVQGRYIEGAFQYRWETGLAPNTLPKVLDMHPHSQPPMDGRWVLQQWLPNPDFKP